MSATLPADDLASRLNAAVFRVPGRTFSVETRYTPASAAPLEEQVAAAVATAGAETAGHTLVFLPGSAEIRKSIQCCEAIARRLNAKLLPLHGELPPEQQDLAVEPSTRRKIICSTNVAESSITIEGVTAVVDSGLARVLTHSPWSGLSRLAVQKISKFSAIQRAGRAGRTGPGLAIRLYSEDDFVRRPDQLAPEIMRSELSGTLLSLAAARIEPNELAWLDAPPEQAQTQARELLLRLGACDSRNAITEFGREMAAFPVHPRVAAFVIHAARFGAAREACEFAARLSENRLRFDDDRRGAFSSDIDVVLATEPSYTARRLARELQEKTKQIQPVQSDAHALEKAPSLGVSGSGDAKARGYIAVIKRFLGAARQREPCAGRFSRRDRNR